MIESKSNKIIISFSFTLKIINSMDNLERYLTMILRAVECAKLHHKVIFYTDKETLPYLNLSDIEIKLIDTTDFYFVDDFKIYLLSIITENEILIDTDLFLFSKLKLESNKDLYVDFRDNSNKHWYKEYLNWCIEKNIEEIFPNFINENMHVPNIGILKIENKELKNKYIELYYKVRSWILSKDSNINRGISIILGQYLLGLLITNKKYKVSYCYNNYNYYYHLSGPIKFENGIMDKIMLLLNKSLI